MNPQIPSPGLPTDVEIADFPELWRTLSRYKWHVLGISLVFGIVGTLSAFSEEPIYRAVATVLIEARPPAVPTREVYDPAIGTSEYYWTQTQLIRSRDLVSRVVDRLDLGSNPEIVPPVPELPWWKALLRAEWLSALPFIPHQPAQEPQVIPEERRREIAINSVAWRTSATMATGTQIMRVGVDANSPSLATTIVNTLCDLYVDSGLESRLEATERTSRWLTQRLGDLRTNLETSEKALQMYREQNQLVNVGGTRTIFEEELLDNSRKLRDAQRKKTELASTYWKIQQAGDDPLRLQEISSLLLDPAVQRASNDKAQIELSIQQLEERYGEKHPQMMSSQARLQAARRAYHDQLRIAANGVKAEYEIAAETERALTEIVQGGKAQIRKLDQRTYELGQLEREVQTNREMFDLFLKRFKETDITTTFEPLNARIVDYAVEPKVPYYPDKSKIIMLWTFGGFVLGVLLATLRHLLSETIRSPNQLEELTQLPVLSVLPRVPQLSRKPSAPQRLCLEQPRAPYSEGVRSIRASLYLSDVDRKMKKVLFTSALPREGKSSLASSFAVTMGQMERVLLVDADLRAPSIKKIFDIPKSVPGLVEVLTGQAKLEDALFHHKESGIDILPVAQQPTNPAEVISSAAFQKLIDVLGTRYDRIIFDTPPCQAASDSVILASKMDTVVFVINAGTTGRRAIQIAVKHLRAAQSHFLGHVLNQVDSRSAYGYDLQYYTYGTYGR